MTLNVMTERMPMDAELRLYLDEISAPAALTAPPSPEVRRALMLNALKARPSITGLPNRVQVRELTLRPGLGGRLYTPPDAASPLPVLVYLHGGGWVVGSSATHDPFCRLLSEAAGVMILSVDYRLAPEEPYPAAIEDTLEAFSWAAAYAAEHGGDTQRLLLGGDSAGANLAAVATNRLCATEEGPKPIAQLLLYPVTDHPSTGHASYVENGPECGLDGNLMRWFWEAYAQNADPANADLSPLRIPAVPALPPTLVATAEYDPLRDEGIAYAEKLRAAGVPVTHLHAPDMHHNFPVHPGTVMRFRQSAIALDEFALWLRRTV